MPRAPSSKAKTREASRARETARIVKAIRDRDKRRLPLNVHAMKREDPALLDAAFELRPFLGWKQAVELALGRYDRIRIELEEFVTCEICGGELKMLTQHIEKKHEIPVLEYYREFPDAPVVAEATRAGRMLAHKILPHWEPLWSVEYAVDRVAAWYRAGKPVNIDSVYSYDRALHSWATSRCGRWDDVLRAAALDPEEHRVKAASAIAEEVLEYIRDRARRGLPLNRDYVRGHAYRIEAGAIRHFSSWADAVKAAGLDPMEFEDQHFAYTRKELVLLIRELKREGQALNFRALESAGLLKIYHAGIRHFGSWDGALKATGYSPARHRVSGPSPGPEEVLALIRDRVRSGKPVNSEALAKAKLGNWRKLGAEYFGSWDQALAKAGLDPKEHRLVAPPWTRERLIEKIREWTALGKELSCSAMKRTGRVSAYQAGGRFFGSWSAAIRRAGVKQEDHEVRQKS